MNIRLILIRTSLALLAAFVLIQIIPYRVTNPPVTAEPAWDSPQTETLARQACFDCHSNEVQTPWYGYVAPIAWVVRDHVDEGRSKLNFSEMDRPQEEAHEAGEELAEGEMPPRYYRLAHAAARLSEADKRALVAGLDATLGGEGEEEAEGAEGEEDEHRDGREEDEDEHEDEDD